MNAPQLPVNLGWMGDRSRGASHGRRDKPSYPVTTPRVFYLRRIRINSGGYDSGGAYWGLGLPLYWAVSADDDLTEERQPAEYFFRAISRDDAKWQMRLKHPGARFFR